MKRTTHRSSKGKKLYAVRGKDGRFSAAKKDVKRWSRVRPD